MSETQSKLRSYIERIERMTEEVKAVTADRNEIFSELKSDGFDVKAVRELLKVRAMQADERAAHEAQVEMYRSVVGV